MPAVKSIPDGSHAVTPHLICAAASDAIEFFASKPSMRWKYCAYPAPKAGSCTHAYASAIQM